MLQSYVVLFVFLLTLLGGLAAGKAWERYKLSEGRWIDRRRVRQAPHFILGLNHLVSGQVDLAIESLEKASSLDPGAFEAPARAGQPLSGKGLSGGPVHPGNHPGAAAAAGG